MMEETKKENNESSLLTKSLTRFQRLFALTMQRRGISGEHFHKGKASKGKKLSKSTSFVRKMKDKKKRKKQISNESKRINRR